MCLILNQTNDKRFQEQVYCLPSDIVNMAILKHPNGEFIPPKTNKTNKEFRVPIQVFVPVSQTTTVPEFQETLETDFEPTPLLQIEGTTKTTPEPPNNLKKAHPRFPQLQLKCNYPAAEDAAALLMMARTTSYVSRTDQMPSFSFGLTDSSQEEASTQEGASMQEAERAKSPETANLLEQLENLVEVPFTKSKGDKCHFSHNTVHFTKSKSCSFFARHSCMKGDDCPFDHQLSKYPCVSSVSGGGDACLFCTGTIFTLYLFL
ncbi:hypothetical protein AHAS_Ahas09G0052300 [Arachis hypogaea]